MTFDQAKNRGVVGMVPHDDPLPPATPPKMNAGETPGAKSEPIDSTGSIYRSAAPGTFGPNEWLDLLMACQDGRVTCMRVMEFIERETMPVGRPARLIDEMTNAFLRWPLPLSVCADLCATKQQEGRVGTNLLSFPEAKAMLNDVVVRLLNDPPQPADPATFSKAEARNDWAKPERLLREAIECAQCIQRNIDVDLGGIPPGDIWLTTIHAHAHVIEENLQMLAIPPSAGTEQKERGETKIIKLRGHPLSEPGYTEDCRCSGATLPKESLPAAPTDGTTTPRADAFWDHNGLRCGLSLDFARTLERELALAEKRLGEAQAQLDNLTGLLPDAEVYAKEVVAHLYPDCSNAVRLVKIALNEWLNRHFASLRAQLATSQARLVEVEGELIEMEAMRRALATSEAALVQAKQEQERAWSHAKMMAKTADNHKAEEASLRAANTALSAQVEGLKETARRQYWAMREGDNIVRHIRTLIFPGWTNLSDRDVNECLRVYEKEHNIVPNYATPDAARAHAKQSGQEEKLP